MIHTVKSYGIVNKTEIDVLPELSCFFNDPADVGNLISGSSAFSKTSLNTWMFLVHVLLKPGLENFEHYLASMWDEPSCTVIWAFFGIALLWDCNKNWPFPLSIRSSKFSHICTVAEYLSFLTLTFHLMLMKQKLFWKQDKKKFKHKILTLPNWAPTLFSVHGASALFINHIL